MDLCDQTCVPMDKHIFVREFFNINTTNNSDDKFNHYAVSFYDNSRSSGDCIFNLNL